MPAVAPGPLRQLHPLSETHVRSHSLTARRTVANPFGLALTPDGTTLYIADTSGATADVIDVATGTVGQPITVGSAPPWIAFSPDGATAYVCVTGDNTLLPVDVTSSQPASPVGVGDYPIAEAAAAP
jgi:hyaluronoglucosaminidase